MRKIYVFFMFVFYAFLAAAQPSSKVYWVGSVSGGTIGGSGNWATTSGGAGGSYPANVNYQLIFDGAGTSGLTYTVNDNNITGGYIVATNNTTVILQGNFGSSTVLNNSGYKVDAGSKIIFESIGSATVTTRCASTAYPSVINGELQGKGTGGGMTLDLSTSFGLGTTIDVFGSLRLEGPKSVQVNGTTTTLLMKAGANIYINSDAGTTFTANFDPTSTITISGAGMAGSANATGSYLTNSGVYGNIIYDCPLQTAVRPIFSGGGWSAQNITIKNTGTGVLSFLSASATANTINGNFIMQGAPNFRMTVPTSNSNVSVTVNGNIDIQGGQFDASNGGTGTGTSSLFVKGNLTNAGTIKATSTGSTANSIEFNGTALQSFTPGTIASSDLLSFKINNTVANVTVLGPLTLPSNLNAKLTLTAGHLDMGNNLLYVQNPATNAIVGGTLPSHILGKLRRATNSTGTYLFPVSSSASELASVKIYPAAATGTDFQVQFVRPNTYPRTNADMPSGITGISNYYWDISRPAGTVNADLNFTYGSLAGNTLTASDVRVLHWNGTSPWDNLGGTDGGGNSVDVTGVTTFSPFTLGSNSQVLPVSLLNFSGVRNGGACMLKWVATTDKEAKGFYVERSTDGRSFSTVAFIAANATSNSSQPVDYSYTDNAGAGKLYYRLLMIANSGNGKYSSVLMLAANQNLLFAIAGLYPNPVIKTLNIQVQAPFAGKVRMFCIDVSGRTVIEKEIPVQPGVNAMEVDIATLSKGTYWLQVRLADGQSCQQTFSKQ